MKRSTAGIVAALCFALAVVVGFCAAPASANVVGAYVKKAGDFMSGTLKSLVPSGSNAIELRTDGARIDCGSGVSDYISSDGTSVTIGSGIIVGGAVNTASGNVSKSGANGPISIVGNPADNASAVVEAIIPGTSLTNAAGRLLTGAASSTGAPLVFEVSTAGFYLQAVQTVTVADDAAGTAPASTITPTSNQIKLAYNDVTAGSVGSITETGAQAGSVIYIVHTGTGSTVTFTEIAGQQEIGAVACTLGLSDTLSAIYINSSWHFLSCRDN